MQTITLFEYDEIDFKDLDGIPIDQLLDDLDQLNQKTNIHIFEIRRNSIKAQQYVGIIRTKNVTIQILPKIDYEGDPTYPRNSTKYSTAIHSASANLLHLLSYTQSIKLYAEKQASLRVDTGNWFELLTRFFATELHLQIRQGIDQTYVSVEEQSQTLKGTWDVQKQMLRLPHEQHQFDIRYDSFIADTSLNRVFLYTVSRLLNMSADQRNRILLRDIQVWLQNVTLLSEIPLPYLDTVHFSRINSRFQLAFDLAKLFLEGFIPQLIVDERVLFAFVFDMNILFEKFVTNFLKRYRDKILPALLSGGHIESQGGTKSHYLGLNGLDRTQSFRLKPDILIFSTTNSHIPIGIIDIKYKKLINRNNKLSVSESDIYQMLAYSVRFECRNVLLLYPESAIGGNLSSKYQILPDLNNSIWVSTVNLRQPLNHVESLIDGFRKSINPFLGGRFA